MPSGASSNLGTYHCSLLISVRNSVREFSFIRICSVLRALWPSLDMDWVFRLVGLGGFTGEDTAATNRILKKLYVSLLLLCDIFELVRMFL